MPDAGHGETKEEATMRSMSRMAVISAFGVTMLAATAVGVAAAAPHRNTVADPPPDDAGSIVEDYSYPGAAAILEAQHVKLISGDGHILLTDCATPPAGDIGLIKVHTTEEIGPDNQGLICFKVTHATGRLDLEVPAVYEIRGDGQRPGAGHECTAELTTEAGEHTKVVVNPSGSTPVGIGADPNNQPTTLLQLKVPR
jgi:hypothetical protein